MNKKLILVTGCSRTGTTWTGRMLAQAPGFHYVYEPFNYDRRGFWNKRLRLPGYLCGRHQFIYIDGHNINRYQYRLDRMMNIWQSHGAEGVLIKDPTAVFVTPTLSKLYKAKVIITIRHPLGVAASRKKLGWKFDFKHFLNQQHIMDLLPISAHNAIQSATKFKGNIVIESAALWCIIYSVIAQWLVDYPDWMLLFHEDLCMNPQNKFRSLYKDLELPFSAQIQSIITEESQGIKNGLSQTLQHNHQRDSRTIPSEARKALSYKEVESVRSICGEVADRFYDSSSWAID